MINNSISIKEFSQEQSRLAPFHCLLSLMKNLPLASNFFSMKFAAVVLVLQALSCVHAAATPCKKDACYNNVAVQNSRNPKIDVRKAD